MQREHEREDLAGPAGQGRERHRERGQEAGVEGCVELRRMHRQAACARGRYQPPRRLVEPGRALRWELHGPGQVARAAVAAAVQKAADPPEREPHEQPRGHAVGELEQRQPAPRCKPPGCERRGGQRAEHHEPPCREVEHVGQRLHEAASRREKLVAIFDHVKQPGPHEPPQKHLEREGHDRVGIEAHRSPTPDRKPRAGSGRDQQHHAIPAHRNSLAIVERRKHEGDEACHDRHRHGERRRRVAPAALHERAADGHRGPRRPHGEGQTPAEERHRPLAEGEPRGNVEQRREHASGVAFLGL